MKYTYFEELAQDETRTNDLDGMMNDGDYFTGVHYRFTAENVPAMGFKCYYLGRRECAAETVLAENGEAVLAAGCAKEYTAGAESGNVIENDQIRLTVNENGSVDVLDKKKGITLAGAHVLEYSVDDGDEYTCSNPRKLFAYAEKAEVISKNEDAVVSELSVAYEIEKPEGEAGQIRVVSTFRLEKDSDLVKVKTEMSNTTEDFRLRALFTTPGDPAQVYADTAFDLTSRSVYHREELGLGGIVTMSCRNLMNVPADGYELAIYSASSQEFETIKEENCAITALTLLRSVKRVYVTNTLTRDETAMGIGTRWFTEDGRMKGNTVMEYAFRIDEEGKDAVSRCNEALSYQLPLLCRGIAPKGNAELSNFGMRLDGAVLSRIEKDKERIIARIFNPAESESAAVFGFADGKTLEVKLGKKKIANVDITEYLR